MRKYSKEVYSWTKVVQEYCRIPFHNVSLKADCSYIYNSWWSQFVTQKKLS